MSNISIHAPRVGRDRKSPEAHGRPRKFQSTRPVWGATQSSMPIRALLSNFNPRAPCGARLQAWTTFYRCWNFNPRAPCGARQQRARHSKKPDGFQSTRPVWGATIRALAASTLVTFQSTRPVWGATIGHRHSARADCISIHAPRVGRDRLITLLQTTARNFNPRAPCGARLLFVVTIKRDNRISIHAPRVGRDADLLI